MPRTSSAQSTYLKTLGVYGYNRVEPIVLAALVSGDPLLLIGKAGTGKTYLLNSLSEALQLEHRHYNASLINFDDLIGFPYPDKDYSEIRYLETPATVWQAQSVLIDEISRCRPEHQNRLFSLIHERRIQGMVLPRLRYRWAAMNPCDLDQGDGEFYEGSQALDQALADRFAFVIEVPDWDELSDGDRRLVADPRGEGVLSDDGGQLAQRLQQAERIFAKLLKDFPAGIQQYALGIGTLLGGSGIRLSPRRVRQLTRNLLAVTAVKGGAVDERLFRLALETSLPQAAWGKKPDEAVLRSAHQAAWEAAFGSDEEKWLNSYMLEPKLHRRIKKLLEDRPDADTATLAVTRTLATEPAERGAAFAFALYPVALEHAELIGREGVNELGKVSQEMIEVDGQLEWQERWACNDSTHPEYTRLSPILTRLRGKRKERAQQLFYHLLVKDITLEDPVTFEKEFNQCINVIRTWLRQQTSRLN